MRKKQLWKKRMIAFALSIVMIFTIAEPSVMATETDTEIVESITDETGENTVAEEDTTTSKETAFEEESDRIEEASEKQDLNEESLDEKVLEEKFSDEAFLNEESSEEESSKEESSKEEFSEEEESLNEEFLEETFLNNEILSEESLDEESSNIETVSEEFSTELDINMNDIASGRENNVVWRIDQDWNLIVTGTIDGNDYPKPWLEHSNNIKTVDLSGLDTSQVTSMKDMFRDCDNLKNLDLSGLFNTSQVTDMSGMFSGCINIENLDLSGFDTSQVTNMESMFYFCSDLVSLDLSGFDTSQVTNMKDMFASCFNLVSIDLSGLFNTSQVTDMSGMFRSCGLRNLDLSGFNTSQVTNIEGMFHSRNLVSLDLSGFDTSRITDMNNMFSNCVSLRNLDLGGLFNTSQVTDMNNMFYQCNNLRSLDLSGFDTSQVTNMQHMFFYCNNLRSLNLSGLFNTSRVTNMQYMFSYCYNLNSLDLSGFDTSQVTNMSGMFINCASLRNLDLSGFNTSQVTDMKCMFWFCNNLSSLDISGFDTNTISYYIFDNCHYLQYIHIPKNCPLLLLPTGKYDMVDDGSLILKSDYYYQWYMEDDIEVDKIPKGLDHSIILYKKSRLEEYPSEEVVDWEYSKDLNIPRTELNADNVEIKLKTKTKIYDGLPFTPDVKVTVNENGKKVILENGVDYNVQYKNNVCAGQGTVIINGNGTYTGTVTEQFIINPKPIKKLKIIAGGIISNTNSGIIDLDMIDLDDLPIYVYDGNKQLKCNKDYWLDIEEVKKGKLRIRVHTESMHINYGSFYDFEEVFIDIDVLETTRKNFKGIINPQDVDFVNAEGASQIYTGKALKPEFKVVVNGTTLDKKDFSVKYINNKESGTAYAVIAGKRGYVGKVVKKFEIKTASENKSKFELKKEIKMPAYNGKLQKPKVTIMSGGKMLKAGKDYIISYNNNLHATPTGATDEEKAKINVTGIGNYKGINQTFYFEIKPLDIKKASIKGIQNNLNVTYAKHNLIENFDYENVIYGVPSGKKVDVTITGKGNFTGSTTKKVNVK